MMTTTLSDTLLLSLNTQGFIPGPHEEANAFMRRVEHCLEHLCPSYEDPIPTDHYSAALVTTKKLFDITPVWAKGYYSNTGLAPWHGAATWIVENEKITTSYLQLRKAFKNSPRFLGIYHRDEIIAHEMAHLGRAAFSENRYEEYFAYMTSCNTFRRLISPIVSSLWPLLLFFSILIAILLGDLFLIALATPTLYTHMMWAKLIPIAFITYALLRLYFRHHRLTACMKNLTTLVGNSATAVAYRLTDDEIDAFAHMSQIDIASYAKRQNSLRWHLIRLAYLSKRISA